MNGVLVPPGWVIFPGEVVPSSQVIVAVEINRLDGGIEIDE